MQRTEWRSRGCGGLASGFRGSPSVGTRAETVLPPRHAARPAFLTPRGCPLLLTGSRVWGVAENGLRRPRPYRHGRASACHSATPDARTVNAMFPPACLLVRVAGRRLGQLVSPRPGLRLLRRGDLARGDPQPEFTLVPLELADGFGGRGLFQHLPGAGLVAGQLAANADKVIDARLVRGPLGGRLHGLRIGR